MLGTRIIKYGEIQYVDTTFFSFRQFSAISPIELHYIYISHIHVDDNAQNVHLYKNSFVV